MRRLCLLLILFASLTLTSFSQSPNWPIVNWQPGSNASLTTFIQGYEIKSLIARGNRISVATDDSGKYFAVLVFVENETGTPLIIGPQTCSLRIEEPRTFFLLAIAPDKAARAVERSGTWRDVFGAFLAGMATQQSTGTITDDQGNQSTLTVTTPNYEAQRQARHARDERARRQQNTASVIREIGLRKNTLNNHESLGGWVYFEKKKFTKATFTIFTGDAEYYFPIVREK